MSRKNIIFDDKKVNKNNFCKNKTLIERENIDVNKTLVSKRASYDTKTSFKYFIGYNNNDENIPLV